LPSRPKLSALFEGNARSNKKERNLAIYKAHVGRGYKLQEIADFLHMHYASISRIVVKAEKEMLKYKT
jgi:transposase